MKIALAQINYHIGNFEANTEKIAKAIQRAKLEKADLIVFAELAICGYPPLDFLEYPEFMDQCRNAMNLLAKECIGIAAVVGGPSENSFDGKPLYNSAYFLADGKIQHISNKGLLPNYDVFDEYRYFEQGKKFELISCKNRKIALTICEDLWTTDEEMLYTACPMDEMVKGHPDLIINIAASPFSYSHAEKRKKILKANALKYNLPLVYVNHCGAQTELIFDGGSLMMDRKGNITEELKYFEEDFRICELPFNDTVSNKHSVKSTHIENTDNQTNKFSLIHDALILGIRDYFSKSGFEKAILGLSGGIDSALICVLAVRALGKENVRVVLLPSEFSSDHSVSDALLLADKLGIHKDVIKINSVYDAYMETLSDVFKDLPFDLTEENLQARSRGAILMAMSNKFRCILLNTSNKSELAVGYGTLYGDMCGGLSVIGDLYKTDVYSLADYINREEEIIPYNTITKPPSAELRPGQKDSDSLPDYEVLDKILFQYIEMKKGPENIIKAGFQKDLVYRVLKLVNINEYKRFQAPPVLRISDKAFGLGRRMQLSAKYH
jgi:NAD+ synthase (glutamine-hydrolysing)